MNDVLTLTQTIAALEAQRATLGNVVVDTALGPLRAQLAALQAAIAGEAVSGVGEQRKLVTILFADLVGFTSIAQNLDPEDVREIVAAYFDRWRVLIARQGGVVEKFIGDAVLAVFGLPVAREGDPENAIRAALAMRDDLAELNVELKAQYGIEVAMRVGIHTGPVLVTQVDGRAEGDFAVVGDTVNLANRIENAAPADGVLISHDTYRHVRGVFNVHAEKPLPIKGRAEPTQTYLVWREKRRAFRVATRGVEGIETRMVGRRAELQKLQDAFQAVCDSKQLHALIVTGEAGLGKSRLLYELDIWIDLQPERCVYFKGRGLPDAQALPYALLRSALTFRFEILESDSLAVVREKLEIGVSNFLGDDESAQLKAHFIGHLLGFDFSDSPHLRDIFKDARQIRDRAFRYLAQMFERAARSVANGERGAVAVVLEDLHWADEASLEAFEYIARACAESPILILMLARPAFFELRPDWGQTTYPLINLGPLAGSERRALVEEILRRVENLPLQLRDLIADRSEGSPFYTEELIKMLIDDGVILASDGPWRVQPGRLADLRVPATLVGVVQARLDGLTITERETLQRAAVVGRVFWDSAVAALGGAGAESTQIALEALRRRELIYQSETSVFDGATEFTFKHSILREVTYESVLKRARRGYHAQAAHWLIEYSGERAAEYAGLIAEHFEKAGDTLQAAEWYGRAGKQAADTYAPKAAMAYYEKAMHRALEIDYANRIVWLLGLGTQLRNQARYAEADAAYRQMLHLAELTGDVTAQARALNQIATVQDAQGDYKGVLKSAARAEAIARAAGEGAAVRIELAEALLSAAWAQCRLGAEIDKVRALAERAFPICEATGDKMLIATSLNLLGVVSYMKGDYTGTVGYFERALVLAREMSNRRGIILMVNNLGVLADARGDYATAALLYEEALGNAQEADDQDRLLLALENLAGIWVKQGRDGPAETGLREVLALTEPSALGSRSSTYALLARACLHQDKLPEALEAARQALSLAQENDDFEAQGAAWLSLGLVANRFKASVEVSGVRLDAATCFSESLRIYTEHQFDSGRAETLLEWARHELAAGDPAKGEAMWREARAVYAQLGALLEVERMDEERGGS